MGSNPTKPKKNIHDDWGTIDHLSNYNIIRHKDTGRYGEIRRFKLDPKYHPDDQLNIYEERKDTKQPIVQIYDAQILEKSSRKKSANSQSSKLCGSNNNLAVINQRMPYRLEDLPQLTFPESLLVLRESTRAYEFIFPKSGPFHVTDQMIGLNQDGHIKSWINPDWSKNYPVTEVPTLLTSRETSDSKIYNLIDPQFRDQEEMIKNISDVVQQKCQEGKFPQQFKNLLDQNSNSFRDVRSFISGYINDHKIFIPNEIKEQVVTAKKGEYQKVNHERVSQHNQNILHNNQGFQPVTHQQAYQHQPLTQNYHKTQSYKPQPLLHQPPPFQYNFNQQNHQSYNPPAPVKVNFGNSNNNSSFTFKEEKKETEYNYKNPYSSNLRSFSNSSNFHFPVGSTFGSTEFKKIEMPLSQAQIQRPVNKIESTSQNKVKINFSSN